MLKQLPIYVGPTSQRLNATTPDRRSPDAALTPISEINMLAEKYLAVGLKKRENFIKTVLEQTWGRLHKN